MSLLKTLQHATVPTGNLWLPTEGTRSDIARLINEIVLCEETDISPDGNSSISHFDLYLQAMLEVNADIVPIREYLKKVSSTGLTLGLPDVVESFVETTFKAIRSGPHCAAASFCYGRETVIPSMFKRILNQINISETEAPKFYDWLNRHIQVDSEDHGPASLDLVNILCDNDPVLFAEANEAGHKSIDDKIEFWDSVQQVIFR
jgi:hypothetical protein